MNINITEHDFERFNPQVDDVLSRGNVYCRNIINEYLELIQMLEINESRDYVIFLAIMRQRLEQLQNIINRRDDELDDELEDDLEEGLTASFETPVKTEIKPMVHHDIILTVAYTSRPAQSTDTLKCAICCDSCFNDEKPCNILCYPCGNCRDPIHVDCFLECTLRNAKCPTCRKDTTIDLKPVIDNIAIKIISESKTSDLEESQVIIDGIKKIIDNLVTGKTLNIEKFLKIPKYSCITKWKDMFMIAGCKYSDDKTSLSISNDLKSRAEQFKDSLTQHLF